MQKLLGISAFYHDSAAALILNGNIHSAAQEERFTRQKHDHRFPINTIDYCLDEAGLNYKDIDAVAFYEKPFRKFERLLETYLAHAPKGLKSFRRMMPLWLNEKLHTPREIDKHLKGFQGPIYFPTHHESHAASAFFPSPFEEAAIITLDGVGEWTTTSWGTGRGNHIELKQEIQFPHSLGLLYSAFTYYTGFKVNSGEYKLMGLAPYGNPKYVDQIKGHLIDIKKDGSFWLDQSYFNYAAGLTMTSNKFHQLFGGPPRKPESPITQREMDLAASIQVVTEDVMLAIARHVHNKTGLKHLCMAGGVALNCVGNGRILRDGPFEKIWIQPAAGDAGGALGAALFAWHQIHDNPREPIKDRQDRQHGSYLGPEIKSNKVENYLKSINANYTVYQEERELCEKIADLMAEGKVIGHAHGRMEFGPRALGARSIIGDPRNENMQATMNLKIKFRESFRPFAPSCLREKVEDYFELKHESPYMLIVAPVAKGRRIPESDEDKNRFGIDKLKAKRSDLPSITHVDYSARVQTVTEDTAPRYYKIIKAFEKKTGCSVIVNTSFNIRGEPIVCTAEEAYRCFMFTDMDALVLDNVLCLKEKQPKMAGSEAYKKQFKLD